MNDQGAVAALLQECQQALDQLSVQTPDPEGRADACCAGEGRGPRGRSPPPTHCPGRAPWFCPVSLLQADDHRGTSRLLGRAGSPPRRRESLSVLILGSSEQEPRETV